MFPLSDLHETYTRLRKCFWSNGQSSRSQESFNFFAMSTPWLRAYLTNLLYTWHKYRPWHGDVSRSISLPKGPRSRSHQSFELKGTRVILSFYRFRLVASSLFDRITSYLAYIQHMKGRCVANHFQDKSAKVKVTQVIWSFGRVSGFLFIWPNHLICGIHTTHDGWVDVSRTIFRMKGQRSTSQWSFQILTLSAPWFHLY